MEQSDLYVLRLRKCFKKFQKCQKSFKTFELFNIDSSQTFSLNFDQNHHPSLPSQSSLTMLNSPKCRKKSQSQQQKALCADFFLQNSLLSPQNFSVLHTAAAQNKSINQKCRGKRILYESLFNVSKCIKRSFHRACYTIQENNLFALGSHSLRCLFFH